MWVQLLMVQLLKVLLLKVQYWRKMSAAYPELHLVRMVEWAFAEVVVGVAGLQQCYGWIAHIGSEMSSLASLVAAWATGACKALQAWTHWALQFACTWQELHCSGYFLVTFA